MTEDRWDEIKQMVKTKFEVLEEKTEPLYLKTGLTDNIQKQIGNKQILICNSPMGKIKLEYLVKPVVLERKEHYSKRAGTSSQTEYILSDTEFVRRLGAYKWVDNDWQKIDTGSFEG